VFGGQVKQGATTGAGIIGEKTHTLKEKLIEKKVGAKILSMFQKKADPAVDPVNENPAENPE